MHVGMIMAEIIMTIGMIDILIETTSQRINFFKNGDRDPSKSKSSCARKETVDIDVLVTSKHDDRKIMQSIRITSRPHPRIGK